MTKKNFIYLTMMQVQDPRHLCHYKLIHMSAVALFRCSYRFHNWEDYFCVTQLTNGKEKSGPINNNFSTSDNYYQKDIRKNFLLILHVELILCYSNMNDAQLTKRCKFYPFSTHTSVNYNPLWLLYIYISGLFYFL